MSPTAGPGHSLHEECLFAGMGNTKMAGEDGAMFYSVLTIYLCLIFLFSAISKLIRIRSFVELARAYEVLPSPWDRIFACLLPFLEMGSVVLLLFRQTNVWGLLILVGLLSAFAWAVGSVIRSGKVITCGCYGKFMDARADGFTLVKIASLFVVCIVLLWGRTSGAGIDIRALPITGGAILFLFTLLAQKTWISHQNSLAGLQHLQKGERP